MTHLQLSDQRTSTTAQHHPESQESSKPSPWEPCTHAPARDAKVDRWPGIACCDLFFHYPSIIARQRIIYVRCPMIGRYAPPGPQRSPKLRNTIYTFPSEPQPDRKPSWDTYRVLRDRTTARGHRTRLGPSVCTPINCWCGDLLSPPKLPPPQDLRQREEDVWCIRQDDENAGSRQGTRCSAAGFHSLCRRNRRRSMGVSQTREQIAATRHVHVWLKRTVAILAQVLAKVEDALRYTCAAPPLRLRTGTVTKLTRCCPRRQVHFGAIRRPPRKPPAEHFSDLKIDRPLRLATKPFRLVCNRAENDSPAWPPGC